jgi:iron complex transport system substrate-binding protein
VRGRLALIVPLLLLVVAQSGCERRQATPDPVAQAAHAPKRVVCLTPSTTELVAALGATDWIVGVDQYSTYPPKVRSLPKVGDFLAPSMDAILALTPDIVFVDDVQTNVATTLKNTKIRPVAIRLQDFSDVRVALLTAGTALGLEDAAQRAVARLDASISTTTALATRARQLAGRAPRVLFIVDRQTGGLGGMVAAGPGSYIDDLIHRLGAENVLAASPVRYAKISAEQVLTLAPEIILDAVHTTESQRARADWDRLASVPAVKGDRVYILGDPVFVSPGPRLAEAFARLAQLVWPGAR